MLALAVLLTGGVAHAEAKWPKRSVALYLGAGGTYVGGDSIGGPLLAGEYALGRKRWQLVTEGSVRWLGGDRMNPRVGGAARWLARSWRKDEAAIELYFDLGLGGEVVAVPETVAARPIARVGWGMQVNLRDKHQLRLGVRFTMAPRFEREASDAIACRGACSSNALSDAPFDDGMECVFGFAW